MIVDHGKIILNGYCKHTAAILVIYDLSIGIGIGIGIFNFSNQTHINMYSIIVTK